MHAPRSVYAIGAGDGLWIGLTMGICMLCMIMSMRHPALSLVGLALFVVTPYLVWRFLRRGWVSGEVPPSFSAVWLHGICIFLFGGLIMALIMYVTLRYLSPGWIEMQIRMAVEQLGQTPDTAEQARTLARIADSGQLPSPIYTAVSSIWLVAFTGSMWSMVFAFVLARTARFKALHNSANK